MTPNRLRSLASLFLLSLVAACATQTEVVKVYDNPDASGKQYDNLLVIGITGDEDTRRGLENTLSAELNGAGVEATSGYTLTEKKDNLLKEDIDAAAHEAGADGILITHFVSIDTQADIEEGRTEVVSVCRGGDPEDYFLYDYEEIKIPHTMKVAHTVVAVSNLYDAVSGERLWSIQSTCFEKSTFDEVLQEEARVITKQLVKDGLIG